MWKNTSPNNPPQANDNIVFRTFRPLKVLWDRNDTGIRYSNRLGITLMAVVEANARNIPEKSLKYISHNLCKF